VAGRPQFTHVSVDGFRVVRDNLAGGQLRYDRQANPYTLFTAPGLVRIGLKNAASLALASAWIGATLNLEYSGETLPSGFTISIPVTLLCAGVLAMVSLCLPYFPLSDRRVLVILAIAQKIPERRNVAMSL